ncbi:hypothetical protein ABPG72_019234 [Tetrahymena utriculariae]
MYLNPNNKSLQVKLDGTSINLIQDGNIFALEQVQSCLPTYENLEQIEVLYFNINLSFTNELSQLMLISPQIIKLLKSFKKIHQFYFRIDFNPNLPVLQNVDFILNQIQNLPIKVFSFQHSCDYLTKIEYFSKHLAMNSIFQLEDIQLSLKILSAPKGQVNYFVKLMQNLQVLVQKNQSYLKSFNLTLAFVQYEEMYEMDYSLLSTLVECPKLTSFTFQTNVQPNQYLPLPQCLLNQQLLHLQNLNELNLEFQNYESSRLDFSLQLYLMCYKRINSLRLINSIESLVSLNITEINPQIKTFSFSITSISHKFNADDFNSLKLISTLRNLVHLRIFISQPSSIFNREYNCLVIVQEILQMLSNIVNFEMKIKGFIDSQNFMRFFSILREKQFLIRLKQMYTSASLQNLMFQRRQLIQIVNLINKKDYLYNLKTLFRRDVIIDMLRFKAGIKN